MSSNPRKPERPRQGAVSPSSRPAVVQRRPAVHWPTVGSPIPPPPVRPAAQPPRGPAGAPPSLAVQRRMAAAPPAHLPVRTVPPPAIVWPHPSAVQAKGTPARMPPPVPRVTPVRGVVRGVPAVQARAATPPSRILAVPTAIVQCKLGGPAVRKIAATAMGKALKFDDENPQQQDLDQNRTLLIEACGEQLAPATQEHLTQVAAEINKKMKPRKLSFSPIVVQVQQVVQVEHLDVFHNSAENITVKTGAATVFVLARVEGQAVTDQPDGESVAAGTLRAPDNSKVVTDTTGDGEVESLVENLDKFFAYLENTAHQSANRHFTVALSGSWGACDGCKKRIARFRQLWRVKAAECMEQGTTARLTITYQYRNAAKEIREGNLYGWGEDSKTGGWYWHTETDRVDGTKEPEEI